MPQLQFSTRPQLLPPALSPRKKYVHGTRKGTAFTCYHSRSKWIPLMRAFLLFRPWRFGILLWEQNAKQKAKQNAIISGAKWHHFSDQNRNLLRTKQKPFRTLTTTQYSPLKDRALPYRSVPTFMECPKLGGFPKSHPTTLKFI